VATWILIIFVIAVALAPLAHFVPSKQQRKVAGLRQYAAMKGLFVEFRSLPVAAGSAQHKALSPAEKKRKTYTDGILFYGRRHLRSDVPRQAWLRAGEDWRPLDRAGPAAPEALGELPAAIQAVSIDREAVGVYWKEQGGEGDIDRIATVIGALAG
jgi:hypothetical protein